HPRNLPEHFIPTLVKHGASIGANATVVCGVTIGEWAFVGAGSVVTRDVPPYALVLGVPGRVVGSACQCGETLSFRDSEATCSSCHRAYERGADHVIRLVD
ncbi:MAG: N-acetyltransferase, partial [Candidatus Riflebacteria bacterium]|nr:N-acetyltransferase [Candidatus Riflebacteria bacterium]